MNDRLSYADDKNREVIRPPMYPDKVVSDHVAQKDFVNKVRLRARQP